MGQRNFFLISVFHYDTNIPSIPRLYRYLMVK